MGDSVKSLAKVEVNDTHRQPHTNLVILSGRAIELFRYDVPLVARSAF